MGFIKCPFRSLSEMEPSGVSVEVTESCTNKDHCQSVSQAILTPGSDLQPYLDLMTHLDTSLAPLNIPLVTQDMPLFRAITIDVDDSCYAVGKTITWQAYSSSTTDPSVLVNFLKEDKSGLVFVIESNKTGSDISSLLAMPAEREVLFARNSRFEVTGVVTTAAEKKKLLGGKKKWRWCVEGLKVCKVKQVDQ